MRQARAVAAQGVRRCPRRDSNPYSRFLKPVPLPLDYAGVRLLRASACVIPALPESADDPAGSYCDGRCPIS